MGFIVPLSYILFYNMRYVINPKQAVAEGGGRLHYQP